MQNVVKISTVISALSFVVIFGVSSTRSAFADGPGVPFSATFSGDARFDPAPPEVATQILFNGSGYATHLGSTTNVGVLAPIALVPVPTTDCELGLGIPHINMETFTSANGDQLVLEMNDLACPVDDSFLIFRGTGHWKVVHGTGRFAGASGSGTVVGGGDFVRGVFEIFLEGRIAY